MEVWFAAAFGVAITVLWLVFRSGGGPPHRGPGASGRDGGLDLIDDMVLHDEVTPGDDTDVTG